MALWLVAVVVAAAVGVVMPTGVADAASNNTISGTVSADGGGPLAGIDVRLYAWPAATVVAVRASDGAGGYSFAGLSDGTYRVKFSDQVAGAWVTEFHAGASSLATASDVVVSGGAVAVIDAALTPAGSISGVVTDQDSGAPLAGMQVRLFREPGRVVVAQRLTAADGSYAFQNPGNGTYRLRFLDPGATYLTEFWDDKPYYAQAGDLVLAPGTHLTANAAMRAPTSISGTVTDEKTSLPIAGLEVRLYREPGRVVVANATTAADGSYTFANPGAGTYRLRFSDPLHAAYVTEFWDDAPTYAAAPDVVVAASASAEADAALAVPELSMTVNVATDGSDAADDGVCEVTAGLGNCSLRAAIDEANVHPGHDQITITPGVNPTLTMGGLVVESDLAILGNGATIHNLWSSGAIEQQDWDDGADPSPSSRTLSIADAVIISNGAGVVAQAGSVEPDGFRPGHVSLEGVTIATSGTAFQSTGATFDITDSTLDASDADETDDVAVDLWAGAVGTIDSSTLIGASSEDLSLMTIRGSDLTLRRSTAVSSGDDLAAILVEDDDTHWCPCIGSLTIDASTVVAAGSGTLIAFNGPRAAVHAHGSVLSAGSHVCWDPATSGGYNIVSDASCGLSGPGDLQDTDALLGPLADNGGLTQTMLPAFGSPAIDHIPVGTPGLCDGTLPTDQRGVLRPLGAGCDAGSVEQ